MKPIPVITSPDIPYRTLPIKESGEKLISLTGLSHRIKVFPFYQSIGIQGAIDDCYVREGVAARLARASEKLPNDRFLVALDGYRPHGVQLQLYNTIRRVLTNKGLTGEDLEREVNKFVAYPSDNLDGPEPHASGGSIDLTIATSEGWLDMGTDFDEFIDRATTAWYEKHDNLSQQDIVRRNNRRLLYNIMMDVGFVNYESEWWHFDFGNQRWSMFTGKIAMYKGLNAPSLT
jgi:zinc D-Ala-D-Ala dipeptidase